MEKTRTLPPLVRGRVSGVLDFCIDEIKLRNRLDNFDLILQIQWWGEHLPTFIRPRKSFYEGHRFNENTGIYYEKVKYEIKTTLDLFTLYLQTCEVLEFCVLDTVKNYIIGSAFFRDLTKLLNKSNNVNNSKLKIFNYLGEDVGELLFSFTFLEMKQEKISYKLENEYNSKLKSQKLSLYNKSEESYFTPTEESFLYNSYKEINGKSHVNLAKKDKYASSEIKISHIKNSYVEEMLRNFPSNLKKGNLDDDKIFESIKCSCKCLPEIKSAKDSSKILHFALSSPKSRKINEKNKNFIIGVTNKFNSNSIKCKSKSKKPEKLNIFPSNHSSFENELYKKKGKSQSINKKIVKKGQVKQNEIFLKNKLQKLSNNEKSVSEVNKDIPLKERKKETKVLDYLLGSELSKEDEESAVNEFKKMSPSHNLVTSINQLFSTSDSDSYNSGNMHHSDSLKTFKFSHLNFNLDNPIERNYYEKFFLTSKPSFDLELAQLLNQPENSVALEKLKPTEVTCNKKNVPNSNIKRNKFSSALDKEVEKLNSNKNFSEIGYNNMENKAKDCSRCNYYKKLNELDTIIESLKHFEEKMLTHEKDLQLKLTRNKCELFN